VPIRKFAGEDELEPFREILALRRKLGERRR
jgi:hypothetical protein